MHDYIPPNTGLCELDKKHSPRDKIYIHTKRKNKVHTPLKNIRVHRCPSFKETHGSLIAQSWFEKTYIIYRVGRPWFKPRNVVCFIMPVFLDLAGPRLKMRHSTNNTMLKV